MYGQGQGHAGPNASHVNTYELPLSQSSTGKSIAPLDFPPMV